MTDDAPEVVDENTEVEVESEESEPVTGEGEPEETPREVGPDGYPLNTPVADMTIEEEAAYWRSQARKHERTSKQYGKFTPAEVKAMALRIADIEDSQKTEEQRVAERLAAAEQRAESAEGRYARLMAAATHDIPADLLDFIGGTTQEEIEASAETLGAALTAAVTAAVEAQVQARVEAEVEKRLSEAAEQRNGHFGRPVESLTPGGFPAAAEHRTDGNALLRRMAGRPGY